MNLLTHDEYQALAKGLNLPTGAFINGKARHANSGETFTSINPANGATLAEDARRHGVGLGDGRCAERVYGYRIGDRGTRGGIML